MKRRRKRRRPGGRDEVAPPLRATAVREFTRPAQGGYGGDDLWRVMSHIRARKVFAFEPPENVLVTFFNRVATVVGKTYAERGDDAQLADDEALMLVRDLLLDLDAGIIERHRKRKLPPHRPAA
jgi:hypothetical protein